MTDESVKPSEALLGEEDFIFSTEWCLEYFKLSGDKNMHLHGENGQGIVQGTALITRVGSLVSNVLPSYQLRTIIKISFLQEIHIGEMVTMSLFGFKSRENGEILKCRVQVTSNGTEIIMPATVTLYKK